ncbi:hypothetical protein HZB88_04440 [archaeon]|nr:hypothetical protein [archaeon]
MEQAQYSEEIKKQIELQQQINAIESTAKQYMESEAISRYGNLKAAHPEKAIQVAMLIIKAVQTGQLMKKLTDTEFKQLLRNITPEQKQFNFKFA